MHPPETSKADETSGTPRPGRSRAGCAGACWIWSVFGLSALAPGALVAFGVARGLLANGIAEGALTLSRLGTLVGSAVYALLIALVAVVLAWPAATALARSRPRWFIALATPMLLPSYLAYAGWSILRAPTTPLGRLIGGAPEHGMPWLPMLVGRAIAVWGLALWAWPLAALVIAVGLRSLGPDVTESLRLERCGRVRRSRALARSALPSIAVAATLLALLMLGSAVPLHVAQVKTFAIAVWTTLDEHPGEPWRAWVQAWPLVLVAGTAGWLLAGPLARAGTRLGALGRDEPAPQPRDPLAAFFAFVPWALAVLVPLALFLTSMGSASAPPRFVRDASEAIASSAGTALCVGIVAGTLALGSAQAAGAGRSGTGQIRLLLTLALAWALLPGILVGSAVAQFVRVLGPAAPLAESAAPVVLAHLSRFSFLPLLVGVWVGSIESRALGDLRAIDGALGLRSWASTALRSHMGPAIAVSVATGCLSFHEIEASIQVQPPGLDHLAQRLLQWLHYERMAELSAASVVLLGIGVAASAGVLIATRAGGLRTRR